MDNQASADDVEAFSVSDATHAHADIEQAYESTYRAAPSNEVRIWKAKKGQDLIDIIKDWSTEENISMSWSADDDYELDYDVFISGTFENAIEVLLSRGIEKAPKHTLSEMPYHLHIGEKDS